MLKNSKISNDDDDLSNWIEELYAKVHSQSHSGENGSGEFSIKELALLCTEAIIRDNDMMDMDEETKRDMVEASENQITKEFMLREIDGDLATASQELLQKKEKKEDRLLITERLKKLHQVRERIESFFGDNEDQVSDEEVGDEEDVGHTEDQNDKGQQ